MWTGIKTRWNSVHLQTDKRVRSRTLYTASPISILDLPKIIIWTIILSQTLQNLTTQFIVNKSPFQKLNVLNAPHNSKSRPSSVTMNSETASQQFLSSSQVTGGSFTSGQDVTQTKEKSETGVQLTPKQETEMTNIFTLISSKYFSASRHVISQHGVKEALHTVDDDAIKTFQCNLCTYKSDQVSNLYRHKTAKHGGKTLDGGNANT